MDLITTLKEQYNFFNKICTKLKFKCLLSFFISIMLDTGFRNKSHWCIGDFYKLQNDELC